MNKVENINIFRKNEYIEIENIKRENLVVKEYEEEKEIFPALKGLKDFSSIKKERNMNNLSNNNNDDINKEINKSKIRKRRK